MFDLISIVFYFKFEISHLWFNILLEYYYTKMRFCKENNRLYSVHLSASYKILPKKTNFCDYFNKNKLLYQENKKYYLAFGLIV